MKNIKNENAKFFILMIIYIFSLVYTVWGIIFLYEIISNFYAKNKALLVFTIVAIVTLMHLINAKYSRISRAKYFLLEIPIIFMQLVFYFLIIMSLYLNKEDSLFFLLLFYYSYIYPIIINIQIYLITRRSHDLNFSHWVFIIYLIPVVDIIFAIALGCSRGSQGENRYGKDPLQFNQTSQDT